MLTQENLIALIEAIESLLRSQQHLRAEILVLLLMNAGLPFSLVNINRVGTLHRPYVANIFSRDKIVDKFNFSLASAGVYDKLPGGIFHQFLNETTTLTGAIQQYRQHRAEELHARLFFEPWERELFYQHILMELHAETVGGDITLILGLGEYINDCSADTLKRICLLLPYLHRIAGCIHVLPKYLTWILGEQVSVIPQHGPNMYYNKADNSCRDVYLGVNAVVGPQYYSDIPVWKVIIGPLIKPIFDFIPSQPYGRVVDVCYKYLLPCHIEVVTEYLQSGNSEGALLCSDIVKGRVGLNLAI